MRERRPKGLLLSKHRRITPAYAGKNALINFYSTVQVLRAQTACHSSLLVYIYNASLK